MSRKKQKKREIRDISVIKISEHALRQFCERYKEAFGEAPRSPEKEIRYILKSAEEVVRHMDFISRARYADKSRYWSSKGWHLVTDIKVEYLITSYRRKHGARRWRPKRTHTFNKN